MAVTATTANIWWRRLRQNNLSLKSFFKRTSHEWCPLLVDISQYSSLLHHTSAFILPTSVFSAAQTHSSQIAKPPSDTFINVLVSANVPIVHSKRLTICFHYSTIFVSRHYLASGGTYIATLESNERAQSQNTWDIKYHSAPCLSSLGGIEH